MKTKKSKKKYESRKFRVYLYSMSSKKVNQLIKEIQKTQAHRMSLKVPINETKKTNNQGRPHRKPNGPSRRNYGNHKSWESNTLMPNIKQPEEIAVIIYTYDRYKLLVNLLNSINRNIPKDKKIKVYIFDDASPKNQIFDRSKYNFGIHYHKFERNHGRFKWYREINYIYNFLKSRYHQYYFFFNDDMEVINNGLQKAINIWHRIQHPNKTVLNLLNIRGPKSKWVPKKPKNYNPDTWKVYYTDTTFMCQYKFLRAMNFRIWKNEFKSSWKDLTLL